MSKKLVVANWKMNPKTAKEALRLVANLAKQSVIFSKVELVVCPPFVYLPSVLNSAVGFHGSVGAQNISSAEAGLHTGEVSASMIKSFGVTHVILGHSERRFMGETDELVGEKLFLAFTEKLIPIVAVGENEKSEDAHKVLAQQLKIILGKVSRAKAGSVIFAYEPRWAISKGLHDKNGLADTPDDALEKMLYIRRVLAHMYDAKTAQKIKILYGGSVRANNIKSFVAGVPSFDGVLVGGASLDADEFSKLIANIL